MALGLLGGLILAGGGKTLLDKYYEGQQADQLAQSQGIMGNIMGGAEPQAGPMQPGQQRQMVGTSGLLANPYDPIRQAQAVSQMTAAGFEPSAVSNIMKPFYEESKRRETQRKERIDQQYRPNQFYKDQSQMNTAFEAIKDDYVKDVSGMESAFHQYDSVMGSLERVKGDLSKLDGTDDQRMLRAFIKTLDPTKQEAFQRDDQAASLLAGLGFGSAEAILNTLKGEGNLDEKARSVLINAVHNNLVPLEGRYMQRREQARSQLESARLSPERANEFMFERQAMKELSLKPPRTYTPEERQAAKAILEERRKQRALQGRGGAL